MWLLLQLVSLGNASPLSIDMALPCSGYVRYGLYLTKQLALHTHDCCAEHPCNHVRPIVSVCEFVSALLSHSVTLTTHWMLLTPAELGQPAFRVQLPTMDGLQEGAKNLVDTAKGIFTSYPGVDGNAIEPSPQVQPPLVLTFCTPCSVHFFCRRCHIYILPFILQCGSYHIHVYMWSVQGLGLQHK
jgi:hypothetical protein